MKKKVVLFGTIPLAKECLTLLNENSNVDLVGVVTDINYKSDEELVLDYARRHNIPILS